MRKFSKFLSLSVLILVLVCGVVVAKSFPLKEVKINSPWEPGGLNDVLSRLMATHSSEFLGKPIIVENMPGGGGVVGTKNVERAKPDGHTLITASSSTIFTQYTSATPNDINNLAPVIQMCNTPPVLAVKDDAPWKDLSEFLEYAKKNPGKILCANSGTGGSSHLYTQLLESRGGIKLKHIPYKGFAPSMAAVLGGHVDATIVTPNVAEQYVKAGQARILAVAGEERFYVFPDAPTFREHDVDLVIEHWVGFMAPKGTPQEVIDILVAAFEKGMNKPEFKEVMKQRGLEIKIRTGKEFADFLRNEDEVWRDIILGTR